LHLSLILGKISMASGGGVRCGGVAGGGWRAGRT
jgi:hypothetical protein